MGNTRTRFAPFPLTPRGPIIPLDPPVLEDAADVRPVALPEWNFPTRDSVFFDRVGFNALPANLAPAVVVVTFTMPPGYDGVVRWMSNVALGAGFIDGSGDIIWQILRDGQAVEDYENMLAQLGTLPIPTDTFILVEENSTIQITVATANNPPAGRATSGCRLKGWRWPKTRRLR